MVFSGVAANNDHQIGLDKILDGTGITAVANGAEQPFGRRVLAVAGGVINAVGANNRAGNFLRQVGLFIAAFAGADKTDALCTNVIADREQACRHQIERLIPACRAETPVFTN